MNGAVSDSPLGELQREHSEVVRPLLRRLEVMANLLGSRTYVPPLVVGEGLRLWEGYLHGVHRNRLEALRSRKSCSCGTALEELLDDHERSRRRMAILRELLEQYRVGDAHSAEALAGAIRSATQVDEAWIRFEEEQPFSCLARERTAPEWAAVAFTFRRTDSSLQDLEGEVRGFLDRPIGSVPESFEIRCNVGGCPSRASVAFRGTSPEGMQLGPAPTGWAVRMKDGVGFHLPPAPVLAFYCPAHVPRSANRPPGSPGSWELSSDQASVGTRRRYRAAVVRPR